MTVQTDSVTRILGGSKTLGGQVRTTTELRRAVERGLSVEALESVARYLSPDEKGATELKYRIVPRSTLQRRTRLTPEESEKLERLARLTALAQQVWGDAALAHEFLTSKQPQLGGERPLDLAWTDLGAREVEALLFSIEYALPV